MKHVHNLKTNNRLQKALIVDAMGGGICEKHGEFLGSGKYGLRACPFCDIEEHYKLEEKNELRTTDS